jgi:hypothetical protein
MPALRTTPPPQLEALWPAGTCAKLGLAGATNVSLADTVSAMINASNGAGAARALNTQLKNMLAASAGPGAEGDGGGGGVRAQAIELLQKLAINCTDVPTTFVEGASEITQRLYCGYYQSRCGGTVGAQQYAIAYDWKGTGPNRRAGQREGGGGKGGWARCAAAYALGCQRACRGLRRTGSHQRCRPPAPAPSPSRPCLTAVGPRVLCAPPPRPAAAQPTPQV